MISVPWPASYPFGYYCAIPIWRVPKAIELGLNAGMDTKAIRRKNLIGLIHSRANGNVTAFAEAVGRPPPNIQRAIKEPSLDPAKRDSQRDVGEKLARSIEEKLALPSGWMDIDHDQNFVSVGALSERERILIERFRLCAPRDQDAVFTVAGSFAKQDIDHADCG